MFRFISVNTQSGLRPVILSKVRNGKGNFSLPTNVTTVQNGSSSPSQHQVPTYFSRNKSGVASNRSSSVDGKVESFIDRAQRDSLLKDVVENEVSSKINYFKEQIALAHQYRAKKDSDGRKALTVTIQNIMNSFDDEGLRSSFTSRDLFNFVHLLNFCIYNNRVNRLSGNKNRDSDQYSEDTQSEEMLLRSALLNLSDNIANGEFSKILHSGILSFLFYSMNQFQQYQEMINLWENGVNSDESGKLYLDEKVLAVILPVAYNNKRFTYEDIIQIYELNVKDKDQVYHDLLTSIGKISISAGDYSRSLDSLEALLKLYESDRDDKRKILSSLADLHLSFIGGCKDIKIARHFFDKVIQDDLPYLVKLKVPHVQSLLQNCHQLKEPFDTIIYFWKSTFIHYNKEKKNYNLNSRYSILNNGFFQIFFQTFPQLNEESFEKLREIIATYKSIKPIDEVFINTIISNCTWGSKEVLEQIIENYSVYEVPRTPVSFRICLKKTGEISEYTNEEILAKWNDSLRNLDSSGFTYIPIADWAALRDATILSEFSESRKDLYLTVLNAYKDYIQDEKSCARFVKTWRKSPDHFRDVTQVCNGNFQSTPTQIEVPDFSSLRPNINCTVISAKFIQN